MSHLDTLNPAQKIAATTIEGPLLIIAGAGAGKTKTIVHRILEIISRGINPESILAVTFTNKAAREMRERVAALLPHGSRLPLLTTFHSFGATLLREHAGALGFTKHFIIRDQDESLSLVKETLKSLGYDPKEQDPRSIRDRISRAKNNFLKVEDYAASAHTPNEKLTARIWEIYQRELKKQNCVDFDDLLLLPIELFEKYPNILLEYQTRYQYIHIDEYQDTNEVQYRLAELLSAKHHNLCVVGDADQTIYTWRGAKIENILKFEEEYPDATVVLLEENYRSTANILAAANAIIKKNEIRKEKNLFTKAGGGEKITTFEGYDEKHEAMFVAERAGDALASHISGKEIAVLYRTNFQSRAIEEAMIGADIPYTVLGVRFYERKEVKDLLSYIRAAFNRESSEDIKRSINTPTRGIGKTTLVKVLGNLGVIPPKTMAKIHEYYNILDAIREYAVTHPASETVKFTIKKSGLEAALKEGGADDLERLLNLEELVTLALRYDTLPPEEGIVQFLSDSSLQSEQDEDDRAKEGGVRLMTVHAAKGLEFDTVFVVGIEDGLFPLTREGARLSREEAEEERRLMYVAVTRAKKKLYLTHAMFRTIYGSKNVQTPSEFLFDIPEEIVVRENGGAGQEKGAGDKVIYFDL